jgi:hypothetical protein
LGELGNPPCVINIKTRIENSLVLAKDAVMPAEITGDLQVQNENLLQIIHQMREDMEDLTKQLSQRTAGSNPGVPITEGNRELLSDVFVDTDISRGGTGLKTVFV